MKYKNASSLRVLHKLTKLQANVLADLLKVGLAGLKNIKLNINVENQEDYEARIEN